MPFNESLADRVRAAFARAGVSAVEKRMMGGLCFMVDDKMCVGLDNDHLMVRLDPEKYEWALNQVGCLPMEFTGRPMRGFVWVDPEGYDTQQQLESWLDLALEFNPRAKSSKKKSRSGEQETTSKKRPS